MAQVFAPLVIGMETVAGVSAGFTVGALVLPLSLVAGAVWYLNGEEDQPSRPSVPPRSQPLTRLRHWEDELLQSRRVDYNQRLLSLRIQQPDLTFGQRQHLFEAQDVLQGHLFRWEQVEQEYLNYARAEENRNQRFEGLIREFEGLNRNRSTQVVFHDSPVTYSYRIGKALGVVLLIVGLIWIFTPLFRHAKTESPDEMLCPTSSAAEDKDQAQWKENPNTEHHIFLDKHKFNQMPGGHEAARRAILAVTAKSSIRKEIPSRKNSSPGPVFEYIDHLPDCLAGVCFDIVVRTKQLNDHDEVVGNAWLTPNGWECTVEGAEVQAVDFAVGSEESLQQQVVDAVSMLFHQAPGIPVHVLLAFLMLALLVLLVTAVLIKAFPTCGWRTHPTFTFSEALLNMYEDQLDV